jgi:hypothetical protein
VAQLNIRFEHLPEETDEKSVAHLNVRFEHLPEETDENKDK